MAKLMTSTTHSKLITRQICESINMRQQVNIWQTLDKHNDYSELRHEKHS